ncbi:MAG: hypothetical protein ABR520_00825 [Mycobacteriales bacterium]
MSDEARGTGLAVRLTDVRQRLVLPPTPDIAAVVRAVLDSEPDRTPGQAHARRRRWLVSLLAAAVLTPSAVLAASPGARDTVARWLRIRGVAIERVPSAAPLPTVVGAGLALGDPTTLATARARASFPVALPTLLGTPDEVYAASEPAERVSLVYAARPGLPAAPFTSAGAVLTELRAGIREDFLKKLISAQTSIDTVTIGGIRGYYISGSPHVVMLLGANGQPIEDTVALAGDVLLWERDGVTYRLESALSKAAALRLAESLR